MNGKAKTNQGQAGSLFLQGADGAFSTECFTRTLKLSFLITLGVSVIIFKNRIQIV